MKPGDSLTLKDVLDPKPGPLISTVAPVASPVPVVVRDDLGLFGEANVIAAAINSAAGKNQRRLPLWVRLTAFVMAVLALTPIILSFF